MTSLVPPGTARTPDVATKLPQVGTTIFSIMSALAQEHRAVNLGQGFPDFGCDPRLIEAVSDAMQAGHNQYPPMPGVPALREAIAAKIEALYGRRYDPQQDITVTAGATQGILTAILAVVRPGDEVIVLEPCYDSYEPNIVLAGGTAVFVPLGDDGEPGSFRPDFDRIAAAITPRTRALILNTPHNPSATVWRREDMQALAELLRPTKVLVISDEVYEHMVYDGRRHESVASHPELAARSLIVSSFGKTYHVTGWKVGYVAAPATLSAEFRKVHQFNVFTVNTPMQVGLAAYMADPRPYLELGAFYQRKRDFFRAGLASTRFRLLPSEGSYFQCVDYSGLGERAAMGEVEFCRWLTTEIGVAAIPLSVFYRGGREQHIVRFCYAKQDATLSEALRRLAAV
ncbi:pyridoxal phosphate-dependent aminotransferase [Aquabacterium sp. A7-Y]|uniref:pyridoxal phosphate-dependent aminotransferase n=1 Tax=Aquabacterium sp. A7-Y TaxID=1349605 RepID=UPI00223C98C6|nr:pyridoxal phosphate-dependent aminotransferase [Aquabacterium sp. A7-Y]MCW7537860.1 pyridoxal phosphate-dependent aminotransferase [Aquabacterium sp. A7-Y]